MGFMWDYHFVHQKSGRSGFGNDPGDGTLAKRGVFPFEAVLHQCAERKGAGQITVNHFGVTIFGKNEDFSS